MTDLQRYNEFAEAAYLNKKYDPWVKRREPNKIYAMVVIASCEHKDWWYNSFIGIECMVELDFYQWGELRQGTVVRLGNTRVNTGMDISAKDFIII